MADDKEIIDPIAQATKDMDDVLNGIPAKQEPATTTGETVKSETIIQESKGAAEQTEKKPEVTETKVEKETPKEVEKPAEAEKKYADVYTNVFDLTHGVQELAKQLKLDNKELIGQFSEAQKSGDWSKVEAKYKELQSQFTKAHDQKKPETKDEIQTIDKPAEESEAIEIPADEIKEILIDTTRNQVLNDPSLVAKFKRFGVEMPQTQEDLDNLEIDHPTLWTQWNDKVKTYYDRNIQQASAFQKAEREAPVHNNSQKEKTKQQIEGLAKQWKVDLKAEDIDSFLNEAMKSPFVFEEKHGVKFLRDNALYQMFLAQKAGDIFSDVEKRHTAELEKVKVETETEARRKAHEDLTNNDKKGIRSISTAEVAPGKKNTAKKIDWNDPEDVRHATEEDAKAELDAFLSR